MDRDAIAQDILATAAHLRTLPHAKQESIVVIGWSYGGAGVLATLAAQGAAGPSPFRAAVAYYPVCGGARPWQSAVPTLILLAGRDDIAPPDECQSVIKRLPSGHPVQVRTYPKALHGFDAFELLPAMKIPGGGTIGYDPDATNSAWEEIKAFLTR